MHLQKNCGFENRQNIGDSCLPIVVGLLKRLVMNLTSQIMYGTFVFTKEKLHITIHYFKKRNCHD